MTAAQSVVVRTMFDTADAIVAPPPRMGISTGDKAGPWIVEAELGRGGMGVVYAVTHETIGKRAALKVLHGELMATKCSERILLEAKVVNRVSHPGIVDIFETGELPDGRAYIVMERLDGMPLSVRMAQTKLMAPQVIDILLQVCDALAAAHGAGIVHRDLKPDNIFLAGDQDHPTVKIVDWGIAKVTSESNRTIDGQLVGTPHYLSPEQARGGTITPRSDVYSLGVLAYELFLEELPFDGGCAAEILTMHLREAPQPPNELWPDIPTELDTLLLAMLAKAPEQRPSLAAVVTTLESVRVEVGRRIKTPAPMSKPTPVGTPIIPAEALPFVAHAPTVQLRQRQMPRWQLALGASAFAMLVVLLGISRVSDSAAATATKASETIVVGEPEIEASTTPVVLPAAPVAVAESTTSATAPATTGTTGTINRTDAAASAGTLSSSRPSRAVTRASAPPRRGQRVDPDGTLVSY